MKNLLLKLMPLLFLLLVFSCTKENELLHPQPISEISDTRSAEGIVQGIDYDANNLLQASKTCVGCPIDCDNPCTPPDFVGADDVTETTASIKFGHATPICGLFYVQILNHDTGIWMYVNGAENPLDLTGLDPCTTYTIGVSHITEQQACLPATTTFTTEC